MPRKTSLCLLALALLFTVGCGSGTVRLQGEVTYDGEPIKSGTIQFVPVDLSKGPTTGASIANGRYEVPAAKGALAGVAYKVEIVALRKNGKTIANIMDPKGPPLELDEQFLPDHYNKATTLQVEVKGGDNRFDFALESKPKMP